MYPQKIIIKKTRMNIKKRKRYEVQKTEKGNARALSGLQTERFATLTQEDSRLQKEAIEKGMPLITRLNPIRFVEHFKNIIIIQNTETYPHEKCKY